MPQREHATHSTDEQPSGRDAPLPYFAGVAPCAIGSPVCRGTLCEFHRAVFAVILHMYIPGQPYEEPERKHLTAGPNLAKQKHTL